MLEMRTQDQTVSRPARRRVAVVLNGNARSVNKSLVAELGRLLVDETLFVSQSLQQSKFIARQIVNRGFDVVLCGGGDGTFTRLVSDIALLRPRRMPALGVLRLGTGNALAEALGAGRAGLKGLSDDLRRARSANDRVPLPLVRVEGQLAPFAGIGNDSLVLEDYNNVRSGLSNSPLRRLGEGHAGYTLAIATRSIWRMMREARPEVVIRNEGASVWPIDLRGAPAGPPIARGEVVYRGPVNLAAVSTIPYYGFGARMFPQACLRPDRFQLRISDVPLRNLLAGIPQIISGEFDHERLWDFTCEAISISMLNATPLQIGGDLVGHRRHVSIGVTTVEGLPGSRGVDASPAPLPTREDVVANAIAC